LKREGQFWFAAFGLLFGIPLLMSVCSLLTGKVDEERAKAAAVEKIEVGEPPIGDVRGRDD